MYDICTYEHECFINDVFNTFLLNTHINRSLGVRLYTTACEVEKLSVPIIIYYV